MAGVLKCGDITASTLPLPKSGLSAFRADIFAGRVYAGLAGQNATRRFIAVNTGWWSGEKVCTAR